MRGLFRKVTANTMVIQLLGCKTQQCTDCSTA